MKNILFTILAVITVSSLAQADENFRLFDQKSKTYKPVPMTDYKGRWVSSSCKKGAKFSCAAIDPKPGKAAPKKVPLLGHPASDYCQLVGGKSRILFDKKNDQYDFCLFKDGSMTDSWGLHSQRANK